MPNEKKVNNCGSFFTPSRQAYTYPNARIHSKCNFLSFPYNLFEDELAYKRKPAYESDYEDLWPNIDTFSTDVIAGLKRQHEVIWWFCFLFVWTYAACLRVCACVRCSIWFFLRLFPSGRIKKRLVLGYCVVTISWKGDSNTKQEYIFIATFCWLSIYSSIDCERARRRTLFVIREKKAKHRC